MVMAVVCVPDKLRGRLLAIFLDFNRSWRLLASDPPTHLAGRHRRFRPSSLEQPGRHLSKPIRPSTRLS